VTDVPSTVARPLIHGLKTPVVARDNSIRDVIPVELTTFDTAVERALSGTRQRVPRDPVAPEGIQQ
jgi:hypothetical protein